MDSLPRKRNRGAAVDRANLESTARLRNDGESSTSLASHLSFQQQRKRTKGLDLHPTAASVAPPSSRRGCFPTPPERGLKRKIGCILASTRTGRKRKIEKDYDFGLELGRGKFGLVRICKSKATGKELACKTLPKKTEENVYKEIEIMQHLSGHPNVVTLQAVYEDAESLHLVMELCTGGRLTDEMSRTGRYSEHQAANLIKELITVIKYCHQLGVVHRDIKPENILRTSSGQLKLADFGLSTRFAKGQNLSGVVGTPSYIAPEVLAGTTYSEKVDVWGAGVLLHALLIGILPFRGASIEAIFEAIKLVQLDFHSQVWQPISGLARDLLSRMLSRDVEKRPSPQQVLSHPWIKFYTESNVKTPPSIPYTESNVKIPGSIPVKDQCSEETPLPLSSYKREKRAQFANSIPTEYGEDESWLLSRTNLHFHCLPLKGTEKRAQFANSIPTEYGEDESWLLSRTNLHFHCLPLKGTDHAEHLDLDFHSQVWQPISGLARDLVSRMLSRDVEKRPSPQEVLSHPWIKFYTESNVKIPPSIPYTESNVNIPPSIPKGKNCSLAVKDQCLEETPLPLSSYKREKRAQFANSIPTEYGEDESFVGTLQGFSRLRQLVFQRCDYLSQKL